ncbi:hypothetical protein E2C01_003048 [Portunus trituberculatus]|uniref:Uncharacterized protein n=1 Tax=Portunus trituberculatus TaxID=210409 RepID=A0A5B7CSG6_PORTR|nr:hypothetical protein [Portunus trituberculatus]
MPKVSWHQGQRTGPAVMWLSGGEGRYPDCHAFCKQLHRGDDNTTHCTTTCSQPSTPLIVTVPS